MRRREFITLIGGAAATWPLTAAAQQSERVRRIGMLYSLAEDDFELLVRREAFEQALGKLGWTNGANIRIGYRWAQNDPELIRKFVAELVASGPMLSWPLAALSSVQWCGRPPISPSYSCRLLTRLAQV